MEGKRVLTVPSYLVGFPIKGGLVGAVPGGMRNGKRKSTKGEHFAEWNGTSYR